MTELRADHRAIDTVAGISLPRLSLRKNFIWMGAGETLDVACRWGLLVVLTKLLNPQAVGVFGLALAVTVPIMMFFNMGLRHAQATDVSHLYTFRAYRELRRISTLLAVAMIAIIAWRLDPGAETWQAIMLVALARAVEAQSDVYYGLFQNRERLDYVAKARMIRGPLALVLFAIGITATSDLRVGCVGLIAAASIVLVLHNMRLSKHFLTPEERERAEGIKGFVLRAEPARIYLLVRTVFPLGCVAGLSTLQSNMPRYFIEHTLGLEALGYFIAVAAPYSAVTRLVGAVAHSASNRLAHKFKHGRQRSFLLLLGKMGFVGLFIGGVGVALAVVTGKELLSLLYSPAYAEYWRIFVIVMIGALIRVLAQFWQFGILAARQFWAQFGQQTLVLAAAVAGNWILVPLYGLEGAAVAIVLAASTHLAAVVAINVRLIRRMNGGEGGPV